jgi:hypothetical protein
MKELTSSFELHDEGMSVLELYGETMLCVARMRAILESRGKNL